MEVKLFEVRDRHTFLPCIGILTAPGVDDDYKERWLLRQAGYGGPIVLFGRLRGETFNYDVYEWRDRTMETAHAYVTANWDRLSTGDVVDVEFILGETTAPKRSECEE